MSPIILKRADGFVVTDGASAVEHVGLKPKLVKGRADNIKVMRPEDLALAEFFLDRWGEVPSRWFEKR